MDRERIANSLKEHNGNPPSRLISEHELPAIYQIDLSKMKREDTDDLLNIAPRERKQVIFFF
jgi:hypothetical protein